MNEIVINLEKVINKLLPETIEKGLEKACQIVENEAKQKCPVNDGTLRASITHKIENKSGIIGSNLEYAVYVHEGTGLYAKDGKGRKQVPWIYKDAQGHTHVTKGNKPNPFLQEAIDENMGDILKCWEGLLDD